MGTWASDEVKTRQVHPPARWADPGTLAHEVLVFVAGRRRQVWLVGGAVRDRLLRRETKDLDLVVRADAIPLAKQVADRFDGAFYPLDPERDYGRAVLNDPGSSRPLIVDVAALQGETLEEDLRGRDFTINAMAVRLDVDGSGELIDPVGGINDLRHGVLRLVSEQALAADPIRLLRAPRLAGELRLRITAETIRAIRETAPRLAEASAERVRDELWRMIGHPGCARAARVLWRLDLLGVVLPEMTALLGMTQSAPHHWDVFEHTVQTMQAMDRILALILGRGRPQDVADALLWEQLARYALALRDHLRHPVSRGRIRAGWLRWLAMTHDWGKAVTRTEEPDGRIRFLGHDREGARLARERLLALRFSQEEVRRLSRMVRYHMRPLFLTRPGREVTGRAIYRFFRDAGDAGVDLLLFSLADHRATFGPDLDKEEWQGQVSRTMALLEEWFERRSERISPPPLLDGHALIEELNLQPGPLVGRLLEAIREAQAAGEVRDRSEALALARRLYEEETARETTEQGGDSSSSGQGGEVRH